MKKRGTRGQHIVNEIKRELRQDLITNNFKKVSIDTYIKGNEVVILKSVVLDTNKYELNSLSRSQQVSEVIKNKKIRFIVLERKTYSDTQIRIYTKNVFSCDTHGRNRSQEECFRYTVFTNVNNIEYKEDILSVG